MHQSPEHAHKWRTFMQSFSAEADSRAHKLMEEMILVSRGLYQLGEQSLEAADISFAQYRILMSLLFAEQMDGRADGLNPSEISEWHGTSRNTISSLLRNLEEDEYVVRHLDENDRRKFNICLTEAGRELVRQHARTHLQATTSCFNALTAEEQELLSQLLHKIGMQISN
jgi:MarR family transcriptional regulator, organic hydroperoxide resistance regulator